MHEISSKSIREAIAESLSDSSDSLNPLEADRLALWALEQAGFPKSNLFPRNPQKVIPSKEPPTTQGGSREVAVIEIPISVPPEVQTIIGSMRTVTVGSSYRHGDDLLLLITPCIDFFNGKFVRDHCADIPPLLANLAVPTLVAGFALFLRAMNEYDKVVDRVVYGMKPRTIQY